MDYCPNNFCGCQYYKADGIVQAKVYLTFASILIIVFLSLRIGSQWFIFKDYYPMKQSSPILCIMMIAIIAIQLVLYPLGYTFNYFSRNWGQFKYIYRALFHAFDGTLYFMYLLRSLRLVYAHQIDTSRSKTIIFKFFKHEYNLILFALVVMGVKIIPILLSNYNEEDLFLTYIDINIYSFGDQATSKELGFGIKQILHQFIWLGVIIYCLWIQTLVHRTYSMKKQLLFVIGIGFCFNISSIILYDSQIGQPSIILSVCFLNPEYPILQMMRDINVILLFLVSFVYPIFQKRVYHMMLPIGRHHDIVKTMRDFLMVKEFIDLFAQFLQFIDNQRGNTIYNDNLESWKKLMVIKYKFSNKMIEDYQDLLIFIKEIINSIEANPPKEIHTNLLSNLKQSILSLQQYENESEPQRQRLIDEISEKIEQLELIFLQKLNQIYKTQYRQTKSYYYLKMYMNRNKKININMITMGMAVMVENQDAL